MVIQTLEFETGLPDLQLIFLFLDLQSFFSYRSSYNLLEVYLEVLLHSQPFGGPEMKQQLSEV